MRTMTALSLLIATAAPAAAHDFWIAPERYAVDAGEPVTLDFLVGHGSDADAWDLRWRRINNFESRLGDRAMSHLQSLTPVEDGDPGAQLSFEADGHHVIAFASHHAFSELSAERFQGYLEEEGLAAAATHRLDTGTQDQPGREIYSRRAKTLIDVGEDTAGDPTIPVGHTLEVVPLIDPYASSFDGELAVRILFRGRPLEGARVSLDSLDIGRSLSTQLTDADGVVRFQAARRGRWMVNTVWSTPITGHADADFETIFASLTFGYAP